MNGRRSLRSDRTLTAGKTRPFKGYVWRDTRGTRGPDGERGMGGGEGEGEREREREREREEHRADYLVCQ
jgi:hypothetical protein